MRSLCGMSLVMALTLVEPSVARAAAPSYKIEPLAKAGDVIGSVQIAPNARGLWVGGLNDRGQILLDADITAGGEGLFQYSDGRFTTIFAVGQDGPLGQWPKSTGVNQPTSMNQHG